MYERIQVNEAVQRGVFRMNQTAALAILDAVEPYDLFELGVLVESNPALARTADANGFLPLHKAAWAGDEELAARLLDLGAEADARDPAGNTPLLLAAHRGHTAMIRLLLARGASVNARDGGERTALFASVFDRNEPVGLLLLSCGARFGDAEGERLLLAAKERNMAGLVEALLRAGARPPADGPNRAVSR